MTLELLFQHIEQNWQQVEAERYQSNCMLELQTIIALAELGASHSGNKTEARFHFEAAKAYYGLIEYLTMRDSPPHADSALEQINSAIQCNPDNLEYALFRFRVGFAHYNGEKIRPVEDLKNLEPRISALDDHSTENRRILREFNVLSAIYIVHSKDYGSAVSLLRASLLFCDTPAERTEIFEDIGDYLTKQNEFEAAIEAYKSGFSEPTIKEPFVLAKIGDCHKALGNVDLAARYYQDALNAIGSVNQKGLNTTRVQYARLYAENGLKALLPEPAIGAAGKS